MSKRIRSKKQRSVWLILSTWLGGMVSLVVLYFVGLIVVNDLSGFRSCSRNSTDLSIMTCGKQSLNSGDFILLCLLVLSVALVFSVFTAAIRATKGAPINE